ncbi:MAG: phosphoenolpyruvate synthase [Rhodospirillales bacterium]|nr:phosphoenolpyruvate synthase [Rhodospirillales bacterium]
MLLTFSTKAETLVSISDHLKSGHVLPLEIVCVDDFQANREVCLDKLCSLPWATGTVIVRSSASDEVGEGGSLAGHFSSVPDVTGRNAISDAIEEVILSYGDNSAGQQMFIQPMLANVAFSGVAFTRDPNTSGDYLVINYDDQTSSTSSVTSGMGQNLSTYYRHRLAKDSPPTNLVPIIAMARELEDRFGGVALDIEFAVDAVGEIYLFQVRPLMAAMAENDSIEPQVSADILTNISDHIRQSNSPHPYLLGDRVVYGIMPDWNPAEIIGIRPRQLASTLYRDLITDSTWAYQRGNYGYRNLRGFPLMINFGGLPYIDTRVSFNSFIPQDIDNDLGQRLVNYYTDRLVKEPQLHDKIEFDIVFSCYTLDTQERLAPLLDHGFSKLDVDTLRNSLRELTNRIIDGEVGYWRKDLDKIHVLEERRQKILSSNLGKASRIYWLLEDCRRYGTLPFAGLARAGFIAMDLLRSLVNIGVIDDEEYNCFMASLDTVSSRLTRDVKELSREVFLADYGHLRPGTYDILSPRYDEAPDQYFDWSNQNNREHTTSTPFRLTLAQMDRIEALLAEHGLVHDVSGLFKFIRGGIEGREYAKFVFTRSLSDVLSLFGNLGEDYGFSTEDCSYADIRIIKEMLTNSHSAKDILARSIENGRERHKTAQYLSLPPLITRPEDAWSFFHPPQHPNFITQKSTSGPVVSVTEPDISKKLAGAILMIENADPGFDWIFSHPIAGFITKYGGANSHMAIRAAELRIPAIVGTGEMMYADCSRSTELHIDCSNRQIQFIR